VTRLRTILDEAVADNGYSAQDLTVLAPQNDPYRLDTPARHRDGAWLGAHVADLIGDDDIHVRGLHYALVEGVVAKPNGKPYANNDKDWGWLEGVSKAARWLGYVPFEQIIDQRNAEPTIQILRREEPFARLDAGFEIPDTINPGIAVGAFTGEQPYRLALFGEKASLKNVLAPIADAYSADLFLPKGEISDTMLYRMASAGAEDGRRMIVFCFSDCDPAGWQMPISIARKLQALRDLEFPELEFEVRPIALTPDQVRERRLPHAPLKDTELRAAKWRSAMGVQQTEIDALATLRPRTSRRARQGCPERVLRSDARPTGAGGAERVGPTSSCRRRRAGGPGPRGPPGEARRLPPGSR